MQANYGENEIKSLLQKVRIFNKEIGSYQIFAITENFDYAVKLSNGRLVIKLEELQDDEQDALTPEHLVAIANRFVSSTQTITQQPPILTQPQEASPARSEKKKGSVGKKILIFLIVIIGGVLILSFLTYGGYGSGDSYYEKVMTIEEIERSHPTNFLSAEGTYRENFWGDKIKVNCIIKNSATVATYKDAIVKITYYSKTKTELGSKEYTVYEIFPPNTSKRIELRIDNYNNVNSIGWEVISASTY